MSYRMNLSRNLGLISKRQQRRLRGATVLVSGCGGMGGVCAEVLVRMGVGELVLADHDRFEPSNANRQIHCNRRTVGRYKARVLANEFRKINPSLGVRVSVAKVSDRNVAQLLKGVDVVVNGMDDMLASICLEREARSRGIPIVDAWITPYASVFSMKPGDPHWEEFLDFPTRGKPVSDISKADCLEALRRETSFTLGHFEPFSIIPRAAVARIVAGKQKRPSLAPVVWLSGVLMANEAFKLLVGLPDVGPAGVFYNQYRHQLVAGKVKPGSHVRNT